MDPLSIIEVIGDFIAVGFFTFLLIRGTFNAYDKKQAETLTGGDIFVLVLDGLFVLFFTADIVHVMLFTH